MFFDPFGFCAILPPTGTSNTKEPSMHIPTNEAAEALKQRAAQLMPHILKITDRVYTSVYYDTSNVSMIIGDDGVVIVDSGFSPDNAAETLQEFRKISTLPIRALILTHSHPDHIGGCSVFAPEGAEIWARSNFHSEMLPFQQVGLTPIFGLRGGRQGGAKLPPEKRSSNGLEASTQKKTTASPFNGKAPTVTPTHTFDTSATLNIAGLHLELSAAPGETSDHLFVWLPSDKVVFSGDNVYRSFPNIYPVRGTAYRNVYDWIQSLKAMMALKPAHLVPGHSEPFVGPEATTEMLTAYHDTLSFVLNKTVEGMKQGLTPDELVASVVLPPELAKNDNLGEYYGNIAWTVRNIFNGYLGWFNGNPTTLNPLPPLEEAERLAALAGGEAQLFAQAQKALAQQPLTQANAQWAAQLADRLLALSPQHIPYLALKRDALNCIGEYIVTSTGRNYVFSYALELDQSIQNLQSGVKS